MGPGTPGARPVIVRCETNGNICFPAGSTPSTVGFLSDPKLWYPFNAFGAMKRSFPAALRGVNMAWAKRIPPAWSDRACITAFTGQS
jgi:hypothetical protein